MKLKQYLLSQNISVLIITVITTACLGLFYGYLSLKIQGVSPENGSGEQYILLRGDDVLHNSLGLSEYEIENILMDLKIDSAHTEINGKSFYARTDTFRSGDGTYTLISLTPYFSFAQFYQKMIFVVIVIFFITFFISCMVVQHINMKRIIRPLLHLREETERLTAGALEAEIADEGYGEIGELSGAVESLRLHLRDTVSEQKHYDDNRKFLTSSISHDLKTPVTAVRGYIEGVLDGVADTEEKRRDYLRKAVDKTVLISTMIDDLLLYSKLDLNQLPFDLERVDIVRFLEDCAEDFGLIFSKEKKTVLFENQLGAGTLVQIDLRHFRRVVQNIADNARKHMAEETGCLRILLRDTRSAVIIEFSDNGTGISKEDLPHIFERFYRADSARRAEGSSGLGLAIAKQLVTGMGGRIWAMSEPGQGSSIMISLRKLSILNLED